MSYLDELKFAQKYPFSSAARNIVKKLNVSFEEISEDVLNRAALMISSASKSKQYVLNVSSTELLENEILAFPVSKILIALQKNPALAQKFSQMIADSTLNYLKSEEKKFDIAIDLAKELDFSLKLCDVENFCVSIDLLDYLKMNFFKQQLKLVNQKVKGGKIFLDENNFSKFVSEMVYLKTLNSLNEMPSGIPSNFKSLSSNLSRQLLFAQKRDFEFKLEGSIDPNAFPPCYAEFYDSMLSGKNLPHLARFSIATFLNAIGMPSLQIIELFKKQSNFSEKMTSYQVNRLVKGKISPPSCSKLKEYGLCADSTCWGKNPLKYYRDKMDELKRTKKEEAKKEESKKSEEKIK